MPNKGTSVFVNMERFEDRDTDFIITVLYSNSHLLSIPKFLQFGKFVKNPVSYFLFDVIIAAGKNRTLCDAGEGEADDSAGGDSPTRGLKVLALRRTLHRQMFQKGPTHLCKSVFPTATWLSPHLQNRP